MSAKWYFLIVIVLALVGTASLWWFNQSIQLSRDDLAERHALWQRTRPADYDFAYLRVEDDSSTGKFYRVEVRQGKVVKAEEFTVQVRDRRDIDPPGTGVLLPAAEAQAHSMDGLFGSALALMDEDAAAGRRVYARARFHADNGAVLEFVHRVMGTRRRLQISIMAFRFGPDLKLSFLSPTRRK